MNQPVEINPLALLAAVLFNAGKTEKIKVKPDDGGEEIEVDSACIGIEEEGDALVCILTVDKLMHFMQTAYDFKFRINNGMAILSFEKQEAAPTLLNANGQKIATESEVVQKLMERLR